MGVKSDDCRVGEMDPGAAPDDPVRAAWRSWLSALASDADAAMAAALAYESLPAEGRDAWLDALDVDARGLTVPPIALYAPLLAVECDEGRRARIEEAIGAGVVPACVPGAASCALRGVASDGTHACLIVAPLYLEFVQVLSCRYTPSGGFLSVRHESLRNGRDMRALREVDGIAIEPTPLRVVIEELAHAILADRRKSRELPPCLMGFAHLFGPHLDDAHDPDPSLA